MKNVINDNKALYGILLRKFSLWSHLKPWFDQRELFNKDLCIIIKTSDEFKEEINRLRQELGIPKLSAINDWKLIQTHNGEFEDSSWLYGKSNDYIKKFEGAVELLISNYGLSIDFEDWVTGYLLYNKAPKTYPHFSMESFFALLQNPKKRNLLGLTTKEKEFFVGIVKYLFLPRALLNKKLERKAMKEFKEIMALSKNKRRRLRALVTSLKAIKKPKLTTYMDYNLGSQGEEVTERYTFERLAEEVFGDIESDSDTNLDEENAMLKTQAARLRKQKQRLNEKLSPQKPQK